MRRRDAPRAFGAPNARRREDASNGARRIHRVVRVEEVLARVAPAPLESVSRSGRAGEKVLKDRRSPRERGRMGTSLAPLARRARVINLACVRTGALVRCNWKETHTREGPT